MKSSKLVHNTNNYTAISGDAQCGVLVNNANRVNYFIGLEEWNNNKILQKLKIAYLDSFRLCVRPNEIDKILLFSFNPINRHIYLVGYLYGVKQIKDTEIQEIRNNLLEENWLQEAQQDFHNIGDFREIENHNQYYNCWNSNTIVAEPGKNFILNVRYDNIKIFEYPYKINFTNLFPELNSKWRRLSILYNIQKVILDKINRI